MNLKLTAHKGKQDSISIRTNTGYYLASITREGKISFNTEEIDFGVSELKEIVSLQDHFNTLFNSLIEKDEEIAHLKTELNQFNNPVIQRQ